MKAGVRFRGVARGRAPHKPVQQTGSIEAVQVQVSHLSTTGDTIAAVVSVPRVKFLERPEVGAC